MMTRHLPNHARLHELLADRALQGLSDGEQAELLAIAAECGLSSDELEYTEYDLAAGSYDLLVSQPQSMPEDVKLRLLAAARKEMSSAPSLFDSESVVGRITSGSDRRGVRGGTLGWFAAAAGLGLAAIAWWPLSGKAPGSGGGSDPVTSGLVQQFFHDAPDAVRIEWGDWASDGQGPEVSGVKGEVVWSDTKQAGFMHFARLPANDPSKDQYQLWIIDGTRGMQQRISGGIFNGKPGTGDVYVPIQPGLRVNKAAAFAVTIEQPGGTWVSDMKRRVVIAALKG